MRRLLGRLGMLLCLGAAGPAAAHGGLPVTTQILWRGDDLLLPTQYWGIFVGREGQPWSWICDEAINGNKLRQVIQGGDGTLYATDLTGLTISTDGACSWSPSMGSIEEAGGEVSITTLDVDALVPDPRAPDRLWLTLNSFQAGSPGLRLWRGAGQGQRFEQLHARPGLARGLLVSEDAQRLRVLAVFPNGDPDLITSQDGGASFARQSIHLPPDHALSAPTLLAEDARGVYLRGQAGDQQVLMRLRAADLQGGGPPLTPEELLRVDGLIYEASVDAAQDRLFVATGSGLYAASAGAAPQKLPGLSRAQCLRSRGAKTYACSWNYFPDNAAVAVASEPAGQLPFQGAPALRMQYTQTQGVLACPATSPVARICPGEWQRNAVQLGIELPPPPAPPAASGCALTPPSAAPPSASETALLLLAGLAVLRRGRGRRAVAVAAHPALRWQPPPP